jgi:addiction module RelE/StbE family toxin
MYNIRYRKLANEDLIFIFDTIYEDKPSVAFEYISKFENQIELLRDNPKLGIECKYKNIHKDCRVLIFENYLIFYQVIQNEIIIIRILNSRVNYVSLFSELN